MAHETRQIMAKASFLVYFATKKVKNNKTAGAAEEALFNDPPRLLQILGYLADELEVNPTH